MIEAGKLYKSIVENAPVAIILAKTDGTITEANKAACKLFGYTKEELYETGFNGIVYDPEKIFQQQENELPQTLGELFCTRKNGEKFSIEYAVSQFYENDEQVLACITLNDITSKKQAEQELALLINNTEEAFIVVDKKLNIVLFNDLFKNLYKKYFLKTPEKGHSILNYSINGKSNELSETYQRVLCGSLEESELNLPLPSGSTANFLLKYKPAKDEEGNVIGVFVTATDITEKIKADRQKELESKDKAALINNSRDPIWSVSSDFKLIAFNNAYQNLMKIATQKSPVVGETVFIKEFGEELYNKWHTYYTRALNGEQYTIHEEIYNPLKQRTEYGLISFNPMYDADGKVFGAACYSKDLTEHTTNQLELQKAKEKLERIMESSVDVICTVDASGVFTMVSKAANQVFGYDPNEMTGRNYTDFLFEEDREKAIQTNAGIRAGNSKKSFENRYVKKDGLLVTIEWTACWDEKTQTSYAIARDITEKKKTEEQKEFEKRDKEALINSTQDLIWSVNNDFKLIAANRSFTRNFEDYTGKIPKPGDYLLIDGLFPKEFLNFWLSCYQKALTGLSFKKEVFNRAENNGEEYCLEVGFNPIYKNKEVVGIACFARNITENKLAEQKIRESELRYRSLIEKSNDAICITDAALRFLDVNDAGCIMTGYSREEFLQLSLPDILFAEDLQHEPLKIKQADFRETIRTERRLKRKDGSPIPVEASTTKIDNERYIIFGHDISARKKIEADLRNSEEKYRLLFYSSPLPKWITDLNTLAILDVNEAAIAHYGYSKQEFLTLSVKNLLQDTEIPKLNRAIANAKIQNGVFNAGIFNHRKKNGQAIKVEISCHHLNYQQKDCLIVVASDVTSRELTLSMLTDREAKLKNAQQIAKLGNWEFYIKHNTFYWSEEIYKIWEVPNYFTPGLKWILSTIHPQDRKLFLDSQKKALATNKAIDIEYRIKLSDGSIKWLHEKGQLKRDEQNNNTILTGTIQDVTPQKLLTISLQESNQRYQYVTRATSDAIWDWNLVNDTIHWGGGIQHVFGYDVKWANDENQFWTKNIHPEDRSKIRDEIFAVIGSTENITEHWEADYRFKKKNNEYAFVSDRGFIIRDEQGKPIRMVGAMQDVTRRKESEEQIRKSNERFELIGKAANDAIWEWDFTTNSGWANLTHQQMFGLTREDTIPDRQEWINRLHPDEREEILKKYDDAAATKSKICFAEYKLFTENKGWISIDDRTYFEYNELGQLTRKIGSMADITSRKEKEQHLKLLESVITNANDAVLITEAELFDEPGPAIIYVNEAFEKLTGYTQEEVIGKSPRFLQGPKSDSKELERLSASLRKWEPSEVTVINYKKNGDAFWNNFSVCPVANEKGRFTHCISISRDVTRIKILELQKKLLSDTSHIFNETTDLKDSLVKVLGTTLDFADFILAELWLVSADKRKINLTASAAKTHDEISFFDLTKNGQSFSKGQGMPGFVWKQKSIEQWKNPGTHKYFLSKQAGGEANITGAYGIPLLYDTDVVGVLILGFNKDSGKINNLETVFETFGSHVGAEIKRKQSENALNQVFNTAPDIICTLNFDGYFQRINKAGCTLLEYSEAELLSTPYLSFVHPGDIPILAAEIDKRAVGIDIFYFENRYITKTGKTIWLSWSCRYAADEELIYGVAKDITDKKELEALLNKANTLAKIGGWEIDLPEKTIFWSTITCEIHEAMHGYSPTIENALNFYKKGKNSDNIFRYINEAIETGKSFDDEFKIITAKGNERWVRVIGEAVMNNGKCIRISGSIQDIDERKKTEEEIKLSNERYDMVAKATNDAIWDWNITTNEVKRVNDGYKTLFGYDAAVADADNNFWMNKVHPDDLPGIMKKRNDIFYNTNELYWQDEYRFLKQNGVYAWVNDRGYIIRDEQGKPVRMIGATQDITTLKGNEIQLEKRAKALAVSNEELEQFAYVASHDLQEPLRMVTSFLTLINKKYSDKLDDKGKKYIDFAVDGAKRMRNLILDLLEFSRAGRKQEAAETINLTDLLQEIVMLFRKQIAEKNAVISAVDLPAIQGYRVPLRQVFQNLVGNALKYSSQGKPVAIQVSAIELPNHWQFAIADNGIGISREYFEKIFIIFQRLHNKDEYSGTGMGLAVTKKIVETLGGHIWVESEKGKGSTFYFTLAKELAK